jgi:hypothetical protein
MPLRAVGIRGTGTMMHAASVSQMVISGKNPNIDVGKCNTVKIKKNNKQKKKKKRFESVR